MIIFKCKMCGGDLHPENNATTCECEYCGSMQTIPAADNEKKGNLFNRANRLRMAAEYDKAGAVYTSITAEFPEESEAFWGLCLCKYGIEYVEDPATAKKIPTCHRTRSESIMDDPDFEQACENADSIAKRVYREEAKAIDRLQQDILSVVANESPYDVFICYKETGEDGERTEDSVLAQDVYDALTAKGLKVFFARITLEDKLGQQYEPYIYAALHSAKVMLVVGTQYEYFDAVWVKNEWARFLDMMKSDKTKTLIPCYKGIDAYDMPREFKNLQAQDMGKLGWLQDITRGVMKLCGKDGKGSNTVVQKIIQSGSPTIDSLLKRAFVFLEDGAWESAIIYADKVLDIDVTNSQAYMVKLMADLKIRKPNELDSITGSFEENEHYKKIMRFGDEVLKKQIMYYNTYAIEKKKQLLLQAEKEKKESLEWAERMIYIKPIKKEIESLQIRKNEITMKIASCEEELRELKGMFAGKRRRELEMEISSNQNCLHQVDIRINDLTAKCSKMEPTTNIKLDQREEHYRLAIWYLSKEKDVEAWLEFQAIPNYRDTEQYFKNERIISISKKMRTKGAVVTFGNYPCTNGITKSIPIEWIVLENRNDASVLISKYCLAMKPYNKENKYVTWETCSLRKWLNNDFLSMAFSSTEQSIMQDVFIPAEKNPKYLTDPGQATQDKVFLLSINEAIHCFNSDKERICISKPDQTEINDQGISEPDACLWWLRTPGLDRNLAANVKASGSINNSGILVHYGIAAVRPVICLRITQ